MGNPITWKNVGATTSTSGIGGLMTGASNSMNQATEGVADIFDTIQRRDKKNWNQVKDNNTNELMQQMRQYGSPEELEQAKAEGAFKQLTDGMGAQYDAEKFGSALDNRGNVLMERDATQDAHVDRNMEIEQRDAVAEGYRRAYAGDIDGAREIFSGLGINADEHLGNTFNTELQLNQESRAQQSQSNANETHALNMQNAQYELENRKVQEAAQGIINGVSSELIDGQFEGSTTAHLRGTREQLIDAGVDPNKAVSMTQNVDALLTAQSGFSSVDDAQFQQERDTYLNEVGADKNVFYQASQNPVAGDKVVTNVMDWANENDMDFEVGRIFGNNKDTQRAISRYANQGYMYTPKDGGEPVNVPVTPDMIQHAVKLNPGKLSRFTNDPDKLMETIIESGDYYQQAKDFRRIEQDLADQGAERLKRGWTSQ